MFVITGLNLFLAGMVTVGLPYMVKIFLGLTSQHQGFAEGAMGVGASSAACWPVCSPKRFLSTGHTASC